MIGDSKLQSLLSPLSFLVNIMKNKYQCFLVDKKTVTQRVTESAKIKLNVAKLW